MNRKKLITTTILFFMLIQIDVFPLSLTIKTQNTYNFTLNVLREMDVMMKNFQNKDSNEKFNKIKEKFNNATEEYFGQNYNSAYEKYKTINTEIFELLSDLGKIYMERTKKILDSTSKDTFGILIEFGPNSSYIPYFRKPYDPLKGVKPYNEQFTEKEYHFFFDKEVMKKYLEFGYKNFHLSKRIFEDPEMELLIKKKNKTMKAITYIISRYVNVIETCRIAKQYGIEIYKIKKMHDFGEILRKYNLSTSQITPIFDDRIPDEFKIDAIDNQKLLYSLEKERYNKNVAK